jgi:hypothetical protein
MSITDIFDILSDKDLIAAMPILVAIVVAALVVTFSMIGVGVYLIRRGSKGKTNIEVLGTKIAAQNTGIACIVCALILLLFVFRPIIQAVVDLAKIP